MNSNFRTLVDAAKRLGLQVNDRCNLTVLYEPGQEDLIHYLTRNKVSITASLPCYTAETVDKQRGQNVFERSIRALQDFNKKGYGTNPELELNLVFNPSGAFLPGSQEKLENTYKKELFNNYGIVFNKLYCLANMPIKRFVDYLLVKNQLEAYMSVLVNAFNAPVADSVMCVDTISVNWNGTLYDCDFNNALEIGLRYIKPHVAEREVSEMDTILGKKPSLTIFDIDNFEEVASKEIATDNHCFGCTAGSGSSCGGQLEEKMEHPAL